jgi:hypothetical protein
MAETVVIVVHLLDGLCRAADQRGATGDEVLERAEHRLDAEPALELQLGLEDRATARTAPMTGSSLP